MPTGAIWRVVAARTRPFVGQMASVALQWKCCCELSDAHDQNREWNGSNQPRDICETSCVSSATHSTVGIRR